MTDARISASSIAKSFTLPRGDNRTLRGRMLHPFGRRGSDTFQALHDVSLEIQEGEFFGIVGRNGSGKSTLLKILAGIYHPDGGLLDVRGSVAPFIELGVGFNPDMSGRENLFLNGVLLGLTRKELRRRYDEIVDFAELHDFMDLKLRNFSSGMQVRLAFSIALQSGADILLIDEVLAVGDERFQRKCYEVFEARKRAGQTVVFVSHDMGAVTRFCDRAVLLERGRVDTAGSPRDVALRYYDLNFNDAADNVEVEGVVPETPLTAADVESIRTDRPALELVDAWAEIDVVDPDDETNFLSGERTEVFAQADTAALVIQVRTNAVITDPGVVVLVTDDRGNIVLVLDNRGASARVPGTPGRETQLRFRFANYLAEGWYWVRVRTQDWDGGNVFDRDEEAVRFRVEAPHASGGLVDLPNTVTLDEALTTRA